jgi:hypothetical protein
MDKPAAPDPTSEARAEAELAPEVHNAEQDDESAQAQTLAEEALGRRSAFEGSETERAGPEDETTDMPDVVDHMNQMVTSGQIDNSAFLGERADDDEDGSLGEQGREDDFPRGID